MDFNCKSGKTCFIHSIISFSRSFFARSSIVGQCYNQRITLRIARESDSCEFLLLLVWHVYRCTVFGIQLTFRLAAIPIQLHYCPFAAFRSKTNNAANFQFERALSTIYNLMNFSSFIKILNINSNCHFSPF